MKKMKKILFTSLMCMLGISICSCKIENKQTKSNTENNGPYGKYIAEDLTSVNILNDNYRNYYEIFVRSFYDSNNDGIGDLKGVTQKLDYITDLGFTGIWLMPINTSNSYHKYDVKDYYSIDPSYGTMEDLEELISECHKRNIKIIMDLVLNHSSYDNPLFTAARKAHEKYLNNEVLTEEEQKYNDFYVFYDNKDDVPPTKTVYKAGNSNFYYEANFSSGMPEFNCDSEAVRDEFKKIIEFYLNKGIDGFRLDAVKYYYIDSSTKNIELLSKINKWVKDKNPNSYIVGEMWDTDETNMKNYYTSGIDSFFNFSTSVSNPSSPIINSLNLEGKTLNKYYDGLLSNISIASGKIPAPFLDNHDMPRFTSSANARTTKFKYALLQMMNGSTFTYYGDEVGMTGTNSGASNSDQNVRIPIYWGDDLGQCSALPGATESSYPYGAVNNQMVAKGSIYNFYKKCLLIRNQNPEIARGEVSLINLDKENKILFIKKTYYDSEIGIVFNFSPTDNFKVSYQDYGYNKVVGQIVVDNKEKYIGLQDDNSIILPSYSIAILK